MQNVRKLSRPSRHFLDYPDTFHIILTHFLDYLDTFQIIMTHFLDHPDTFQIVRKLSRSSGHFPVQPHTFFTLYGHFQFVWILSRSSRHILDHPDTFQIIWTPCILSAFCIASGHFSNDLEILQPIMSQKLSGFAKTFRSALLTR